MTVHINQYFALMDQNHGGEKEWRNMRTSRNVNFAKYLKHGGY